MEIRDTLQRVGLGKNEIEVYLALLKFGEGSVSTIAKTCPTHRVNIYDAARSLVSKGLISEFLQQDVVIFKANEPSKILSYLQLQQENVRAILPSLQQSFDTHKDSAQTFYGIDGVKHILQDMIEEGEDIYSFGIPRELSGSLADFTTTFHRNRIKKKIALYQIYNENAQERITFLNKLKYCSVRHLDKKFDVPATTIIYGRKVAIWIFGDVIFSVLITSETMVVAYKKYFDLLWKQAK